MVLTIDEQMAVLMDRIPVLRTGDVNGNHNFLRNKLLEVARNQRHACAEAVTATFTDDYGDVDSRRARAVRQFKDRVHQAVMNTEIGD